jgi:diguanylate cyclase (GGDEF)-like protein
MRFLQSLSVERKSLNYKLMIAFTLMSIIPLLIVVYLVTSFIFPGSKDITEVSFIVLFTLGVAWTGFMLIRHIITPVLDLAYETKILSEENYGIKESLSKEEELGDIAEAVNNMSGKIRTHIAELQEYGKKTSVLNGRIHKKVLTLTNLIRLGDLISTGSSYEDVATFAAEKISGEMDKGFCIIYSRDDSGNYRLKTFCNNSRRDIPVDELSKELGLIEKNFSKNECLVMDARPLTKPWQKELRARWALRNIMFYPMRDGHRMVGVIVAGNFDEEEEMDDEVIGVVRAYEKEIVLGRYSSKVFDKERGMEIVDSLTGLYTRSYLEERLEDEINRAVYYQRPCSLIVIKVDDFEKYTEHLGMVKGKQVLKQIGDLLNVLAVPVGKAARFDYDMFALLLPEKNKRESIDIAEDICKRVRSMQVSSDAGDRVTVSIGVGENPIDGINAKEILAKATYNMDKAKTRGKDQVAGE